MQTFLNYVSSLILFGLISAFILSTAKRRGFFSLNDKKLPPISLPFRAVLVVFAIYLGMTLFGNEISLGFLDSVHSPPAFTHFLMATGLLQFLLLISIPLLFFLYMQASYPKEFKRILKERNFASSRSLFVDFTTGVMTWLIAFPVVLFISQMLDMILHYLFQLENFEQVAVRFLKHTLSSPERLTFALMTILGLAPIIEEFLFRGCLQTFFKKYMSSWKAIFLSSLCFAFFHYSTSQGLGNISLIISLLTFSFFLGFIYEKQASLIASIGLHFTFNLISVLRVLFFS